MVTLAPVSMTNTISSTVKGATMPSGRTDVESKAACSADCVIGEWSVIGV